MGERFLLRNDRATFEKDAKIIQIWLVLKNAGISYAYKNAREVKADLL
jgi:hypothetical protein